MEIGGNTYAPSELKIEEGRMITLPEGAVFADAELTLEGLPEEHPEDAVGLLRYVYNERKIGEAYLLLKDGAAVDADVAVNVPEPEAAEPAETEAEETEAVIDEEDKTSEKKNEGGFPVLPIMIILLLGAAGGGGYYWIQNERKKEAEAAARRREKRRQRLMEEGAEAEAEFNRLLEAKKNRKK